MSKHDYVALKVSLVLKQKSLQFLQFSLALSLSFLTLMLSLACKSRQQPLKLPSSAARRHPMNGDQIAGGSTNVCLRRIASRLTVAADRKHHQQQQWVKLTYLTVRRSPCGGLAKKISRGALRLRPGRNSNADFLTAGVCVLF